jgi:hypothetical protein
MNTWARGLVTAVLVAAAATGCGGGDPATPASGTGPAERGGQGGQATRHGGAGTSQSPSAAVRVRVVVTGGIAGSHEVYEVSRGDTTTASAERALDLAATPAVRDLGTQRHRRPAVECCDIQVYAVTVRYADGTSTSITAATTSAPPQLQRLVSLASSTRRP